MDEQPPDQPKSDSPENTGSGLISEDELEAALAEASSLASDLSEQVGADDTPAEPAGSDEKPAASTESHEKPAAPADTGETQAQPDDLPADLDAELGELERLIAVAESDIGEPPDATEAAPSPQNSAAGSDEPASLAGEPASAADEPAAASDAPVTPRDDSDIPDFMDELTRPAEPAAEGAEPQPAPSKPTASAGNKPQGERDAAGPSGAAVSPKPGVVGTGTVGVVGTVSQQPEADTVEEASTADEPTGPSSTMDNIRKIPQVIRVASTRLAPHVLTGCERGVTLLEWIDRPLARISQPIRRPLGWVALATTGTACILYLYSLF